MVEYGNWYNIALCGVFHCYLMHVPPCMTCLSHILNNTKYECAFLPLPPVCVFLVLRLQKTSALESRRLLHARFIILPVIASDVGRYPERKTSISSSCITIKSQHQDVNNFFSFYKSQDISSIHICVIML